MDDVYEILRQRPDETRLQHHKRLVYGKLVDKTLSDFDYPELSEYVYGQAYSSDVARRLLYGSCKTLQLMDSERIESVQDDSVLDEIQYKTVELQKERQRLSDQRREYKKLINADGRREHLEDRVIEAAQQLADTVGILYRPPTQTAIYDTNTEAVLVFCDWHYGMKANNIWNTYDVDICKRRVSYVVDRAIHKLTLHNCSKLHILLLGDFAHGATHVSARVASSELVCDQLMQVSEVLAQSINVLSQYVGNTVVYSTYGNHMRTVQNKNDSIHRDNMERIIPWWLRERLRDNPTVEIAKEGEDEFLFVDACGHGIVASHGDLDSVKTSTRLLPALFQQRYGAKVECVLLADKHHRESFEELGVDSIICGALCGTDDYANDRRLYSTPEQLMLIVNATDGIDTECHIRCGHV